MTAKCIVAFFIICFSVSSHALAEWHVRPPGMPLKHPPKATVVEESDWSVSETAEVLRSAFTGGILLISFVALVFAMMQVRSARRQMRGQFLFELETRWTNERLEQGVKELGNLARKVKNELIKISQNKGKYTRIEKLDVEKRRELLFSKHLSAMRKWDRDRYRKIKNILEFYETIGVTIYQIKGLNINTVAHLLAGPIEAVDKMTRRHIEQTRISDPENEGFYEHTTRLFDDINRWLAKRRVESSIKKAAPLSKR